MVRPVCLAAAVYPSAVLPACGTLQYVGDQKVSHDDGFDCYASVLIYVDAVMVIHHDAESLLSRIDKYFKIKPSSIGEPDIYFGNKLEKTRLENGV